LGRNARTLIEHHVNLGITKREIPRKLLIVTTVAVHYIVLQIVREELREAPERLVKYKSVERQTWEQPFEYNTPFSMERGDQLKIGEHTFEAKREIVTNITRTDGDHSQDYLMSRPIEAKLLLSVTC
jgi:hypothetical protein